MTQVRRRPYLRKAGRVVFPLEHGGTGDDRLSGLRESQVFQWLVVDTHQLKKLARLDIPDVDPPIVRGGGETSGVRGEGKPRNPAIPIRFAIVFVPGELDACRSVEVQCPKTVVLADRDTAPVRRDRGVHVAGVVDRRREHNMARYQIEEVDALARRDERAPAVRRESEATGIELAHVRERHRLVGWPRL